MGEGLWVAACVGLAGCLWFGQDRGSARVLEVGPITRVEIDLDAGKVELSGSGTEVGAAGTVDSRWADSPPEIVHYLEDGVLHVIGRCSEVVVACRVDVTLVVPAGADIGVHTGLGDVTVRGSLGDVEAQTDFGDLVLEDDAGGILVEAGSGDITGTGIFSENVSARTGEGEVAIELLTAPIRADLRTDRGDIALVVPAGSYRIEADAGNGDVVIARSLTHDASAPNVLVARTQNGDISLATEPERP